MRSRGVNIPEAPYEMPHSPVTLNLYAMCAMRHMYEYKTTSEQLAWVKVAASHHAQHNPNAMLQNVVTVEEVVSSPMIADPLHRLDSCVVSDGGGGVISRGPIRKFSSVRHQASAGRTTRTDAARSTYLHRRGGTGRARSRKRA